MSAQSAWLTAKQQVVGEWKENERLRLISLISMVLFVVWSCIQLEAARLSGEKKAKATFVRLQDVEAAVNERRWPDRAEKSQKEYAKVHDWLWQARNEGEAQARLRDWLEKQARDSGLVIDRMTVELGAQPQNLAIRPARAEIQGVYLVEAFQVFMQKLSVATPRVVVESDEINFTNPRKFKYRISATAWFEIGSGKGVRQ